MPLPRTARRSGSRRRDLGQGRGSGSVGVLRRARSCLLPPCRGGGGGRAGRALGAGRTGGNAVAAAGGSRRSRTKRALPSSTFRTWPACAVSAATCREHAAVVDLRPLPSRSFEPRVAPPGESHEWFPALPPDPDLDRPAGADSCTGLRFPRTLGIGPERKRRTRVRYRRLRRACVLLRRVRRSRPVLLRNFWMLDAPAVVLRRTPHANRTETRAVASTLRRASWPERERSRSRSGSSPQGAAPARPGTAC